MSRRGCGYILLIVALLAFLWGLWRINHGYTSLYEIPIETIAIPINVLQVKDDFGKSFITGASMVIWFFLNTMGLVWWGIPFLLFLFSLEALLSPRYRPTAIIIIIMRKR